MKSLEIVSERIESTLKAEDKLKMELQLCFYKDEAQQIKQDLDVLEIIRKKSVYLRELKHILKGFKEKIYTTMEEVLIGYNLYVTRENELTMEELLKLKQWLEENENDR